MTDAHTAPTKGPNAERCVDFWHMHVGVCQRGGYRFGLEDGRAQGVNEGVRLAAQLVRDHVLGPTGEAVAESIAGFLEARADRVRPTDPDPGAPEPVADLQPARLSRPITTRNSPSRPNLGRKQSS